MNMRRLIVALMLLALLMPVAMPAAAETTTQSQHIYVILGNNEPMRNGGASQQWSENVLAGLGMAYLGTDTQMLVAPMSYNGGGLSHLEQNMGSFSLAEEEAVASMVTFAREMKMSDYDEAKLRERFRTSLKNVMQHIERERGINGTYNATVVVLGDMQVGAHGNSETVRNFYTAYEKAETPSVYFLGIEGATLADLSFLDDLFAEGIADTPEHPVTTSTVHGRYAGMLNSQSALETALSLKEAISGWPDTAYVQDGFQLTSLFETDNRLVLSLPELDASAEENTFFFALSAPAWLSREDMLRDTSDEAPGEAEAEGAEYHATTMLEGEGYTAWLAGGTNLLRVNMPGGERRLDIPLYTQVPFDSVTLTQTVLWQRMPVYAIGKPADDELAKNNEVVISAPVTSQGEAIQPPQSWQATLEVTRVAQQGQAEEHAVLPATITPEGMLEAPVTLGKSGLYSMVFRLVHQPSGIAYTSVAGNPMVDNNSPEPVVQSQTHTFHVDDPTTAEPGGLSISLKPYFTDPDNDALSYEVVSVEPAVGEDFAIIRGDQLVLAELEGMQEGTVEVVVSATDNDGKSARNNVRAEIRRVRGMTDAVSLALAQALPEQARKGETLTVAVQLAQPTELGALQAASRQHDLTTMRGWLETSADGVEWSEVCGIDDMAYDEELGAWTGTCTMGYDAGDFRIRVSGDWLQKDTGHAEPFAEGDLTHRFVVKNTALEIDHVAMGDVALSGNLAHMLRREKNEPVDIAIPYLDWILYEEGDRLAVSAVSSGYALWREGEQYILSDQAEAGDMVEAIAYDTMSGEAPPVLLLRARADGTHPVDLLVVDQENDRAEINTVASVGYEDADRVWTTIIIVAVVFVLAVVAGVVWLCVRPKFHGTLVIEARGQNMADKEKLLHLKHWAKVRRVDLSKLMIAGAMPPVPGITGVVDDLLVFTPSSKGIWVKMDPQLLHKQHGVKASILGDVIREKRAILPWDGVLLIEVSGGQIGMELRQEDE